jgi:hypothetical protein
VSDFPELRRVFNGYLHEDFPEEHGTPSAALRAFSEDANPAERQRFSKEAERFLARTATLEFNEVCDLVARLGCRWTPPSREALAALLGAADSPSGSHGV